MIGAIADQKVKALQTIHSGNGPEELTFSPNEKFLAAENATGTVGIYEVKR